MPKALSATSKDVAKKAGVSRAAVSAVLSNSRSNIRVAADTRQRILAAAEECGYSPHPVARALQRQRSGVIGFVLRSFRGALYEQPIPFQLSVQLMRAAQRRGYNLVEISGETHALGESEEPVRFLLDQRVDGVIFDWPSTACEVRSVVERGLPVVQLLRPQFEVETSTVVVDSSRGIDEAIDHLVEHGHSKIAFIGNRGPHPIDRARTENFAGSLARHGLSIREGYIQLGTEYSLREGYELTGALLNPPERPTALFVASDSLALGALRALYRARIRVPEEISVISYDDTFAAYLFPPLTSVSQPLQDVAERAVSLVEEQVEGLEDAEGRAQHVVLPTHLTVRESTSAPARGSL